MQSLPRLFAPILLLVAGSVSFAADPASAAAKPKEKHPETELHDKMEKMETAYKKLRRQAADVAMNSDSLTQVATLREVAEAATRLEPLKATVRMRTSFWSCWRRSYVLAKSFSTVNRLNEPEFP